MAKQRTHNEWFQSITKAKCSCGLNRAKRIALDLDPSMYAWGNYIYGKWNTIEHFCAGCFETRVVERLYGHAHGCGCVFQAMPRSGHSLPTWLKLPEQLCKVA